MRSLVANVLGALASVGSAYAMARINEAPMLFTGVTGWRVGRRGNFKKKRLQECFPQVQGQA